MKVAPVTKPAKRNTAIKKKKHENDVTLANYDVVVFSPIYDQFSVIQKPNSRCLFCKIYIFLKNKP